MLLHTTWIGSLVIYSGDRAFFYKIPFFLLRISFLHIIAWIKNTGYPLNCTFQVTIEYLRRILFFSWMLRMHNLSFLFLNSLFLLHNKFVIEYWNKTFESSKVNGFYWFFNFFILSIGIPPWVPDMIDTDETANCNSSVWQIKCSARIYLPNSYNHY